MNARQLSIKSSKTLRGLHHGLKYVLILYSVTQRTVFIYFIFKKDVLAKSKYYEAIGSVTDAALSRVLQDILELNDIPELESHRLSELCRILNALEGLFCEDPEHVRNTPNFCHFASMMLTGHLNRYSLLSLSHMCLHGSNFHISPSFWCVFYLSERIDL